jgi:2,5-diketo-D-gluconate reductase A
VNQIEWSPFGHSPEVLEHARDVGVVVQAYSPLTRGERLDDPTLAEVAARHDRTPAQLLLRWCLETGVAAVPKAASSDHREENLGALEFDLDDEETELLSGLNEHWSSLAGLPYV